MSEIASEGNLLWIDLEMTGLNPEIDEIIEIAAIVTDSELAIKAEISDIYINQPAERFTRMDDWNQHHHTKSGLWEKVVNSSTTIGEAESQLMEFLTKQNLKAEVLLCGNSIWQDRRFITKYMPRLEKILHYRMIDISTIKELTRRWYSTHLYCKDSSHRALDDIRESINELQHYRQFIFAK